MLSDSYNVGVYDLVLHNGNFSALTEACATGLDSTFATAFAENSEKFLFLMRKDIPKNATNIIGQFVSKATDSPIGFPISFWLYSVFV